MNLPRKRENGTKAMNSIATSIPTVPSGIPKLLIKKSARLSQNELILPSVINTENTNTQNSAGNSLSVSKLKPSSSTSC